MQTTFKQFVLETSVVNEKGKTVKESRHITLCSVDIKTDQVCMLTIGMAVQMPNDPYNEKLGKHIAEERAIKKPFFQLAAKDRRIYNSIMNKETDDMVPYSVQDWLNFFHFDITENPFRYIGAVRKSMKRNTVVETEQPLVKKEKSVQDNGVSFASEIKEQKVG